MYIYNLKQATFLIQSGCTVISIDISKVNKKVFVLFEKDEKLSQSLEEWRQLYINVKK